MIFRRAPQQPPQSVPNAPPVGFVRAKNAQDELEKTVFLITVVFLSITALLLLYRVALGEGGFWDNAKTHQQWLEIRKENQAWVARNAKISAEVADLKSGRQEIIEAHARYDYLLVRPDEDFFRFVPAK